MNDCKKCKWYNDAGVFELCTHQKSEYKNEGALKAQQHTVTHMLRHQCNGRALFSQK